MTISSNTRRRRPHGWIAAAAIAAVMAGTGTLSTDALAGAASPAAATTVKVTKNAKLGRLLVTSNGRTLYLFLKDRGGKSACYGACATFWPPLLTSAKAAAGAGAKASLLGTTRRKDGRLQVTYDHHPLYLFELDSKPGMAQGEGLTEFGAKWYAVGPGGGKIDND
jgi:predicted lipoprotein with Yx(FWY)xxD motif